MIRFSLYCKREHKFEGWFASNEDYEKQKNEGLILCPSCGSSRIGKSLMAPHIAAAYVRKKQSGGKAADSFGKGDDLHSLPARRKEALQKMQRRKLEVLHKLQELARKMRESAENVGGNFAEEARKIHFGETKKRAIYGEAEAEDVHALLEEGIDIMPLPRLPEDAN